LNTDILKQWDAEDELASFRGYFHIPSVDEKPAIYLCGNSLGLQPRRTEHYVQEELDKWKNLGVKGHFTGSRPWVSYHENAKDSLKKLVGAEKDEVLAVGSLTTNLHLLLSSFYQPRGERVKILIESGAFPSDFYAVHSHMQNKGIDPEANLIEIKPKRGQTFTTEEVSGAIREAGETLALVLLPGVQYYTGQVFDMEQIAGVAHEAGAYFGVDLAHAIGNIPMQLHKWQVDFAIWCSYKYLNSGPGGTAGMFVHEKHGQDANFPKLSGWWGHNAKERFQMANEIKPIPGIDGWQLSNVNILPAAAHLAALSIFDEVSLRALRNKSLKMTGWLLEALGDQGDKIKIITPRAENERGCQLSLYLNISNGKEVFDRVSEQGVVSDWREPNVMRIAPTPLYNTYQELGQFVKILNNAIAEN